MSKKQEIVYLVVGLDKYELPLAVFVSKKELAIWVGKSQKFIDKLLKSERNFENYRVISVDIATRVRPPKTPKKSKNMPPPTTT